MKKLHCCIAAMLLGLFSSVSLASIQSFWAYGSNDDASNAKYIESIGNKAETQNITIDYKLESNWTINSAQLWLRAVDDFRGGHCTGNQCRDSKAKAGGRDRSEKAQISSIEGQGGNWTSTEINGYAWYNLLDVTAFLLNDSNKSFSALLKASQGGDFWYKNAKLVIDYNVKGDPVPPAAVPIPSAIWLFGSALLGLTGLRRKSVSAGIAA
jgi:hypothetical protein